MELVGLGVRTVSFLGIKVYSVGFYADLNNPNLKVGTRTFSDKIILSPPRPDPKSNATGGQGITYHPKYHVRSTHRYGISCSPAEFASFLSIVPTRTTSYTHLRDAFMRALNARLTLAQQKHTLTEEDALAVASPLRKLKTLFPNSPFNKHEPLDIYLAAPQPGHPRLLVFRDLGSVESDWVAPEIVLHYFGDHEPSPPVSRSRLPLLWEDQYTESLVVEEISVRTSRSVRKALGYIS